jgi:hypothetical protein
MRKTAFAGAIAAFLGLVIVAAAPALADMKAFNAAVKVGDYKTAATAAKSAWATWNKSDPDTAVVAREFGFAAYISGDYASAREYGQFLRDHGPTLVKPDDQPIISRVLLSAAEYRLAANAQTRQGLLDALKAREAAKGIDMQSIVAAEALYRSDWSTGNWSGAVDSGGIANRLINRAGDSLAHRALQAKSVAATAGFMGGRDQDDYEKIVETHNEVVDALNKTRTQPREDMVALKFKMEAWAISVESYFGSTQQTGTLFATDVKPLPLKQPEFSLFDDTLIAPDTCMGDINEKAIRYPESAGFRGMVGTVIMKYDTDAHGRLSNTEVLASVPVAQFADAVLSAVPRLVISRNKKDTQTCTLAAKGRITRISFYIL